MDFLRIGLRIPPLPQHHLEKQFNVEHRLIAANENPITNAILFPEKDFACRNTGGGSGVLELRWA